MSVAVIPLHGRAGAGLVAVVDPADLPLVEGHRWFAAHQESRVYAIANVRRGGTKTTIKMHRLLLPDAPEVDHIDGDGLNNRRANLRSATHAENGRNRRRHRNNTSGYKGVYLYASKGKWQAYIRHNGKQRHLGYFSCPKEAARAYDRAARELHGDFARINFAEEGY